MKKIFLSIVLALVATCTVGLVACAKPTTVDTPVVQKTEFVYTGTEITLLSDGDNYTVSGNKATNAGDYTATVTLSDKQKYTWTDGTTEDITISWKITKASVTKPTASTTEYAYSGEEVTVLNAGTGYTVSGNKATNAGTYTAKATLSDKANYTWADGTTDDVTVNWSISKATVAKPVATTTSYTYNGEEVTVLNAGTGYTVSGNKATNAGSYTATATLSDKVNYTWADGTTDDVTISWSISKITVTAPTVPNNLVYTGNAITALQDNDYYTVTNGVQTDAGSYVSFVTLKDTVNTQWADGTSTRKTINWTIAKAQYDLSDLVFENASYKYDGKAHTLMVQNLPEDITVTYTTNTLTDVGTVEVTATLTVPANYEAVEPLKANLTITKADNAFVTALADLKIYDSEEEALVTVYSGKEVSISAASELGTPVITYYTLEGEKYEAIAKQPVNAGTYYVRAEVVGTSNYDGLDSDYVKYVIEKATIDTSSLEYVTELQYNEAEQTVIVNNLPYGLTYTTEGSRTEPGTVSVTITFHYDEANYNAVAPVTKELTVTNTIISISTYEELQTKLQAEENFNYYKGRYITYKLSNDIDCEGKVWQVIGTFQRPFKANFDGNGKTIKNMTITDESAEYDSFAGGFRYYAMFGSLLGRSSVHDVTFENFNISANISANESNIALAGCLYAFVCGRVPNSDSDTSSGTTMAVELYNITIKNSSINVVDEAGNPFYMSGIVAYDFSLGSKREGLHIIDTDFSLVGSPKYSGYFGALAGCMDYAPNYGALIYKFVNCSIEGGTAVVYSSSTSKYMGGIFGRMVKGAITYLTNVKSSLNMYRFSNNPDAVMSNTDDIDTLPDAVTDPLIYKDINGWFARIQDDNINLRDADYTGEHKLVKDLYAQDTAVGEDAVQLNTHLAEEGFSVEYFIGETKVTQITKADFGENESIFVTAQITYNDTLICTAEQKFTLAPQQAA